MFQNLIYIRLLLSFDKDESFQTFGEWTFYRSGAAKLGSVLYSYGTPIHRERFGANLILIRDALDPQILLIETPFGAVFRFQYRPLIRRWYQLVEVDWPWLYACQDRFGTRAAIAIYYVYAAARWLLVSAGEVLLIVLLTMVLGIALVLVKWLF